MSLNAALKAVTVTCPCHIVSQPDNENLCYRKVSLRPIKSVKGQLGQSKVSPRSIQGQSKVSKVNLRSARSIQCQQDQSKVRKGQ